MSAVFRSGQCIEVTTRHGPRRMYLVKRLTTNDVVNMLLRNGVIKPDTDYTPVELVPNDTDWLAIDENTIHHPVFFTNEHGWIS